MKRIFYVLLLAALALPLQAAYFVDGAETGTPANELGGSWITYTDGYSSVTFTPNDTGSYAGNYCRRMNWTMITGAVNHYAGAAAGLNASWSDTDLSAYYGLRFYAKGSGTIAVNIAEEETRTETNHYTAPITLTSSWKLYELPFSGFTQTWGTPKPWDPAKLYAVGFTASGSPGAAGVLYFDNMEFYLQAEGGPVPDPNVIMPAPKVNQLGYLPDENKYFTIVTNTASTNDTFRVFDSNGNTALTGTITGAPIDDRTITGEGVFKVDFSSLTAPGKYHVVVNGSESREFKVAANAYDGVFKDALRCFYLIRCGTAIDDKVTGVKHGACHTVPDTIRGGTGTWDMRGGWHNAGDLGKWCVEEAVSCAYMMWVYELRKDRMRSLKNNIPESKNAVSDLLDEAKWGLDWLLKLQLPDGSVYHKSDTEPDFCYGTSPEFDPNTRYAAFQGKDYAQIPSSIDAANFTAVMAQAARVYRDILPGFAGTCRQAAIKSWAWLKNHRGVAQSDPYYLDNYSAPGPTGWQNDPADTWQEEEWAMAEIYRLTGDQEALSMFDTDTNSHALGATSWMTPEFFGYFSLYMDEKTPQAMKDKVRTRMDAFCSQLVAVSNAAGYGVVNALGDYYWESNENVMHKANNLLMGYTVTGNNTYKTTALKQLGYMLGNNSLDKSFVTKQGTNYASEPYHWIYKDYGILMPGWASGGPNKDMSGVAAFDLELVALVNKGVPPAKCWVDSSSSYASNEGETSENAALVFLSGFFLSEEDAAAGIDTGSVPVENHDDIIAYPSPCNIKNGDKGITFYNMPSGAFLQVYNVSGERVFKAVAGDDGVCFWDVIAADSAPGLFAFSATDEHGFVKRGRVAVIR